MTSQDLKIKLKII